MPRSKQPKVNRKERLRMLIDKAKKRIEKQRSKENKSVDWKKLRPTTN